MAGLSSAEMVLSEGGVIQTSVGSCGRKMSTKVRQFSLTSSAGAGGPDSSALHSEEDKARRTIRAARTALRSGRQSRYHLSLRGRDSSPPQQASCAAAAG